MAKIIGLHAGNIKGDKGTAIKADHSFLTSSSVLFDALYIPGATNFKLLENNDDAVEFINDAYKHCKVIGADEEANTLLEKTTIGNKLKDKKDTKLPGVIIKSNGGKDNFVKDFIAQLAQHRVWEREQKIKQ